MSLKGAVSEPDGILTGHANRGRRIASHDMIVKERTLRLL